MELYVINNTVRRRLYLLYALNVVDWVCTVVLINTGGFFEANPLMRPLVSSIPLGFTVKAALPAVIIAVILRLTGTLDFGSVIKVKRLVTIILLFYIALCINHAVNFILLFFG